MKEFCKSRGKLVGAVAWLLFVTIQLAAQTTNYVATTGNDANPGTLPAPWRTIQHAANVATPGTTVLVQPGTYNEKIAVNVSGSAAGGFITFLASGAVTISGTNVTGSNLVYLANCQYVRLQGFELRDNLGVANGSGVRIEGSGDHLETARAASTRCAAPTRWASRFMARARRRSRTSSLMATRFSTANQPRAKRSR